MCLLYISKQNPLLSKRKLYNTVNQLHLNKINFQQKKEESFLLYNLSINVMLLNLATLLITKRDTGK